MSVSPPTIPSPLRVVGIEEDNEAYFEAFSECQRVYAASGTNKAVLFSMLVCQHSNDGRKLGNTEESPYKDMKFRKLLVPTSKHYRDEVGRRAVAMEIPKKERPQCKYWNIKKLLDWLRENPLMDLIDREWLMREEKKVYDLLTGAASERAAPTVLTRASAT